MYSAYRCLVNMGKQLKRGAFIVFEGCDRSGKSTQSKLLFEFLQRNGIPSKHMGFPARQSSIGHVINAYLTNKQELSDECIHLLFSANRWEYKTEIAQLLNSGTTLVVDRYSYSGVAYSVAKGLKYEWCMAPEKGLIRPDVVFYLKSDIDVLLNRGQFGEERYEKKEFQMKVSSIFDRICKEEQHYWTTIDAGLDVNDVAAQISKCTLDELRTANKRPLSVL